jgi:hypothetical protein
LCIADIVIDETSEEEVEDDNKDNASAEGIRP